MRLKKTLLFDLLFGCGQNAAEEGLSVQHADRAGHAAHETITRIWSRGPGCRVITPLRNAGDVLSQGAKQVRGIYALRFPVLEALGHACLDLDCAEV